MAADDTQQAASNPPTQTAPRLALVPRVLSVWLLARAFVEILMVDLSLRAHGFQRLAHRVPPPNIALEEVGPADMRRARLYARRLQTAATFHVVRARCLHRSLALHRWLRAEGLPSALKIGVRKESGALLAHAWVELAGRVVNDSPSAVTRFTPLMPTIAPNSAAPTARATSPRWSA